jgi:DNA-binding NtrC family response regulator
MATILIIDDDKTIVRLLSDVMRNDGYDIFTASNGKQGIQLLSQYAVDLVITDLIMHEMDGMQVISNIKSYYEDIKIIAISGGGKTGPESYLPLAKIIGANEVIKKPFNINQLRTTVRQLLS